MIELGIVPAFTGEELTKMLASMTNKDRRIAKRKFRKVWRKLAKKDPSLLHMMFTEKGHKPKKHEIRNRSVLVVSELFME